MEPNRKLLSLENENRKTETKYLTLTEPELKPRQKILRLYFKYVFYIRILKIIFIVLAPSSKIPKKERKVRFKLPKKTVERVSKEKKKCLPKTTTSLRSFETNDIKKTEVII